MKILIQNKNCRKCRVCPWYNISIQYYIIINTSVYCIWILRDSLTAISFYFGNNLRKYEQLWKNVSITIAEHLLNVVHIVIDINKHKVNITMNKGKMMMQWSSIARRSGGIQGKKFLKEIALLVRCVVALPT